MGRLLPIAPPARLVLALTAVLLLGLLAVAFLFLWHEHRLIEERSQERALQLVKLLDRQTTLAFRQIDTVLKSSARLTGELEMATDSRSPWIREQLLAFAQGLDQVRVLLYIDQNGRLVESSLSSSPRGLLVAERDYFRIHQQFPTQGLFISPPHQSLVNPEWFVALSRRVSKPDGSFGGVVAALVFSDYFHQFHDTFNLGPRDSISVFHENGVGLARYPFSERVVGKDFSQGKLFQEVLPRHSQRVSRPPATTDGVLRLVAHRKLESLPFVVTLGIDDSAAFSRWKDLMLLLAALYLSAAAMVLILTRAVLRQTRALGESRNALRQEKEFEEAIFEASGAVAFILQPNGRIHRVNAAAEEACQRSRHQLVGALFWQLLTPNDQERVRAWLGSEQCAGEEQTWELEFQSPQHAPRTLSIHLTPLLTGSGGSNYLIASGIDITDRKRSEQQAWYQANYDALTGLPNRVLFLDRLQMALDSQQRKGGSVGLLFIDLDHFKQINDTYGHAVGDDVLSNFAQRLKRCVRRQDTAARYAGDEFTVVLPDLQSTDEARQISERIIDAVSTPVEVEEHQLEISASIGICIYPTSAATLDSLISQADTAMYQAKMAGRNRYALAEGSR